MENKEPMQVDMISAPKSEKEIEFESFIEKMKAGVVAFCYTKKDGSIRSARGTLKPDLLPPMEPGKEKKTYDHTQNYFDMDADEGKGAWRTFIKDQFIGFVNPQS